MRFLFISLLLLAGACRGQKWETEIMPGVMAYNGDLTEKDVSFKRLRPAGFINMKYNSGDYVNFRIGIGYGRVGADDKNNRDIYLVARNLNFKSHILELNACAEIMLLDPDNHTKYPYLIAGVGLFHFNPYTYDKDNKKTYLKPLSTEGQGLSEYPDRKKYSLVQFCIPFGFGWKLNFEKKVEISYEFSARFMFTDYLDDISKTYPDLEILNQKLGPKSMELAYRKNAPFTETGYRRGNNGVRDYYFFTGLKFSFRLDKSKSKEKKEKEDENKEKQSL
jgi:hypothetical protein